MWISGGEAGAGRLWQTVLLLVIGAALVVLGVVALAVDALVAGAAMALLAVLFGVCCLVVGIKDLLARRGEDP